MSLNEKQVSFLSTEFGVNNFNPSLMSPFGLWQLRERLIDCECYDEASEEQIDTAASLVDYMSKLPDDCFPREWKLKSPPEVEAMLIDEASNRTARSDKKEARKMLHSVSV